MLLTSKTPLIVGVIATAALAGYLLIRHPLPNSLSRAHAQVIPGTDLHSCDRCHTSEGLTAGCLACHEEIAGQLSAGQGYHAYLAQDGPLHCASCHLEHQGFAFPLVSVLSWPEGDPNAFDHRHCDYCLTGRHDELACAQCHKDKREGTFSLPGFPGYSRSSTFLGLTQKCLACHVDVHAWPSERECLECHDQRAFEPASAFRHDDVFSLEGVHAKIDCGQCHSMRQSDPEDPNHSERTPGSLPFHRATGKTCQECHPSPHYTSWQEGCQACHLGGDARWHDGTRRMDGTMHEPTGFSLTGGHALVGCSECHLPDENYERSYLDPQAEGYKRQLNTCNGCHDDVHRGQLTPSCATCHQTCGWKGDDLLFDHDRDTTFALDVAHKRLFCQACHAADDLTYRAAGTQCADCHEVQARALIGRSQSLQVEPDPHDGRLTCIDCHDMTVQKQSFASHAQRCAECHNEQYAQLAYRWAERLQQRHSAIEPLVREQDSAAQEAIEAGLSEARNCGFHHLHLALQLYDRLGNAVGAGTTGSSDTQKEAPK